MRTLAFCVAAIAIQPSLCFAQTNAKPAQAQATARSVKPESSHLEFVREYIRELAEMERLREAGIQEINQNSNGDSKMLDAVHGTTLMQLELGSQVRMLNSMRLNTPFDELIPDITAFYEKKIALWRRMGEISGAFIGGPKPGVNYEKLAVEMPQIRAQLDYIDKALFEATPVVFATLIDMRADSQGHASHLIITKDEKAQLLSKLDDSFGAKLNQKDQNYTVSAAKILKDYLNKDFKCSDEPWE